MSIFPRVEVFFDRFVGSLDQSQLTTTEKKLLNLIRNNFDSIAAVGTGQGKRAKKINELIQISGASITDVIPSFVIATSAVAFPLNKLLELSIEDFRGFGSKEEFKFPKRITLIYGPNGTGKSSFCEALEYSMLGYIVEAAKKRIEINKYIKNSATGRSSKPILKAKDNIGNEITLNPSPFDYYFCFIEKNRIEEFSRISSYTHADQQNLLSQLFGLEDFNKFVDEFTENISNYIDIKGKKSEELKVKQQAIEKDKSIIADYTKKISDLESEKVRIAQDAGLSISFDELDKYLHDNNGFPGHISELNKALQNPVSKVYDFLDTHSVLDKSTKLKSQIKDYSEKHVEFLSLRDKIVFHQLFKAVSELKEVVPDKCPVCETSIKGGLFGLKSVKRNPYKNAEEKLKELEKIASIENELDKYWKDLRNETNSINTVISKRAEIAEQISISNYPSIQFPDAEPDKHDQTFIQSILNSLTKIDESKSIFQIYDSQLNELNASAANAVQHREKLQKESELLSALSKRIKDVKGKYEIYSETIKTSQAAVDNFIASNQSLITEAEAENQQLGINTEYVKAYGSIKAKLTTFKNDLPSSMITGLNELTKELYNKINHHDPSCELIDKIELPLISEQQIRIWFQDDPSKEHNALLILSEGHIRCLGLAILLAKVIQEGRKIVIFDDIVNAIDDDHRGGVRELIFSDSKFNDCQIILTTHAEQFIKDLDNQFPAPVYETTVDRFTFLYPENRSIRYQKTTANYLKKASEALGKLEKLDALTNCRKALENISAMFWNKLSKRYQVELSVSMRNPKSLPDLMSIILGLIKFLKKNVTTEYSDVTTLLEWISGMETTHHNIWNYLNKGIHEEIDRQEFDQSIVQTLYDKLLELDSKTK